MTVPAFHHWRQWYKPLPYPPHGAVAPGRLGGEQTKKRTTIPNPEIETQHSLLLGIYSWGTKLGDIEVWQYGPNMATFQPLQKGLLY